jgi:arabinogalactan endo-1,4-beta-galactosidase
MLSASAEVGMVASHDYSSDYIVASDGYLVARLDNGDIFVFNRKTGERTLIKAAKVKDTITINADEISFINRQEKTNDSVVYLDLKGLSRP